jgi:hypothetical protein
MEHQFHGGMSPLSASYTQLPLKNRINQGTAVNIGGTELIPNSNVISTTIYTFMPLTVLHGTSIPWRYEVSTYIDMRELAALLASSQASSGVEASLE